MTTTLIAPEISAHQVAAGSLCPTWCTVPAQSGDEPWHVSDPLTIGGEADPGLYAFLRSEPGKPEPEVIVEVDQGDEHQTTVIPVSLLERLLDAHDVASPWTGPVRELRRLFDVDQEDAQRDEQFSVANSRCMCWTDEHDCVLEVDHAGDHQCACSDVWNRSAEADDLDEEDDEYFRSQRPAERCVDRLCRL